MNAQNKIQLFEPMVRDSLNKLSQYLKTNKLAVNDIFGRFDRDGDLKVSREEFISGITQLKDIAINQVTAKKMFDAIDLNHSDELSFHEFGMHIEGVQQSFEQRKQKIPKFVYDDMKQQILQAFREFDKNNDGKIDASEIMLVMKTIGNSISKQ
jgi:Ca2+-binding EF-hand superfamily protein